MDAYARARPLIDAAHAADPSRTGDGRAAELVYADRMEAWIARLTPIPPRCCGSPPAASISSAGRSRAHRFR